MTVSRRDFIKTNAALAAATAAGVNLPGAAKAEDGIRCHPSVPSDPRPLRLDARDPA